MTPIARRGLMLVLSSPSGAGKTSISRALLARELEKRLKSRAQDSAKVVAERMAKASDEMSHWPEYDYVLVNDDLEASVASVVAILAAERLRRERQIGLDDFVKGLREGQ